MESSNRGIVFLFVMCVILIAMAVAYVAGQRAIQEPAKVEGFQVAKATEPEALEVRALPKSHKIEPAENPDVSPPPSPNPSVEVKKPDASAPNPPQDVETGQKPNPKLLKEPVDEPEMPLDDEKGEKYEYVKLPNGGGYVFERWDPMPEEGKAPAKDAQKISGVVVPGIILVTRGVVELFGCGDGGKEHETVLRLDCDIQSLDNALTLAGFKRGPIPKTLDLSQEGQGSRIIVLVQWYDQDGKLITYRSEDLVVSIRRQAPMPRVGWTYVAKWIKVADPTSPSGDRTYELLAANQSRSLVTTFRDNSALLDNPLEEAIDDTLFAANYMLLPRSGTPVQVIFRPPFKHERDEILALEGKIRSEPKSFRPDQRAHEEENPLAPPPDKPKDGK